jgi:hypothetical protein
MVQGIYMFAVVKNSLIFAEHVFGKILEYMCEGRDHQDVTSTSWKETYSHDMLIQGRLQTKGRVVVLGVVVMGKWSMQCCLFCFGNPVYIV